VKVIAPGESDDGHAGAGKLKGKNKAKDRKEGLDSRESVNAREGSDSLSTGSVSTRSQSNQTASVPGVSSRKGMMQTSLSMYFFLKINIYVVIS
jgi:hypothetical protein